jgi:short-subunit dehydrogenase
MGTAHGLVALLARARAGDQIAVVASLAGYRGLPKAGAYGATKAALINLTEALKPEADLAGIRLRLINPGFVETPLTAQNDFPMPFLIPVERAVKFILDGLAGEQFEIAFPRRFTWVMKLLRLLPNSLFFSLTRRMVS